MLQYKCKKSHRLCIINTENGNFMDMHIRTNSINTCPHMHMPECVHGLNNDRQFRIMVRVASRD